MSVRACRSRRREMRLASSLTAAVLAVLYGAPSPADDTALQEITVTATRRSMSALDVPISITAVSGAALEQAGIQDIAGLARSLAGVDYTDKGPYGGTTGSTLIIRGLNSEGTSNLAFPTPIVPPVATYVDETPLFANLRLTDIDHVEVLRGPQGTLYGSGSLGGTIRIIQNAADPRGFDAKAEAGMSDTRHTHAPNEQVSGMLNLPLSDTFAVRLNAGYDYRAGFVDQPNLYVLDGAGVPVPVDPADVLSPAKTRAKSGVNSYDYRTARIAALWRSGDAFSAKAEYFHQLATGNGYPLSSVAYGFGSLSSADYLAETTRDKIDLAALTLDYDMGFATLTSASSYAKHTNRTWDDGTAVYEQFSFYEAYYGGNPRALFARQGGLDDTIWSQELRLTSKQGGFLDWVGGIFFKNEKTFIEDHEFYPGYDAYYNACVPVYGSGSAQCGLGEYGSETGTSSVDGIALVKDQAYIGDFHTRFQDLALFGELTAHLTTPLSLTVGSRVFKQTVAQSQQTGLLFVGPDYIAAESLSAAWRRALWKVNVSYRLDAGNLAYATWSQGFRRGSVNALPPTEVNGYQTPPALTKVAPDTANNYEVGLKGSLSERVQYSADVYDIEWRDIQEGAQLTPLVLPGAINVGNGYSRGLELEASARLSAHLGAHVGYTYDLTKLTSLSSLAYVGLTVPPAVGAQLPGTPKNSLALGVDYSHVALAGGELRVALESHYQSRVIPAISASVPVAAGFTVLDVRAGFTRAHWSATLYVDNLTDQRAISSYGDPLEYGPQRYSAIVSTPRTVGFTVGYSFKGF